jgi:MoxR-like ATPase
MPEVFRRLEEVRQEIGKVIVGQQQVVDGVLICLFSGGHVLLEGVPGLGKTTVLRTLARVMHLKYSRIQFTPDLMPADIAGSVVMDTTDGGMRHLRFQPGPIFANLVLADEINRATPKTQSALLEAMQERTVTSGTTTHELERPFLVMATQNPIETEGTYPLPEAQVDRFMMKVLVGYPTEEEEFVIVERVTGAENSVGAVSSTDELAALQRECRKVYVDPSLIKYAVKLAAATRDPAQHGLADLAKFLSFGVSPRGPIHLIEGARALAYLRGRTYVLPQDVIDLVPDVFRHRLVLTYEALAEAITADELVHRFLRKIPAPEKPLETHVNVAAPQ